MSDLTLNITLTDAGLAAVAAAHGMGVQAKITHVAVGDQGYVPSAAATGLHHELARVPLTAGGAVAPRQVLVQGLIPPGATEFFIRELGYFLEDGTLLGVWSDPAAPLGWIGGETPWFFKLAFAWASLPAESITVLIAGDAGQAGMALDLDRLEAKVRHTVEIGGGLVWADADNTQLTAAIAAMIKASNTYDIPWMAGWGADWTGEDLAVQGYGAVQLARDITILGEVGKAAVAPAGAALTIDVYRQGVSIYTTRPQVADGANMLSPGVLDPTKVDCLAGEVLIFKVTQVGSTVKGQKLTMTLKGKVR